MSGAEVALGVASAAVAFASIAIQLTDSAQKLQAFCGAFNNAPQHYNDIYQSLQTLAQTVEFLGSLGDERNVSNAAQMLLDRCIAQCRISAGRICSTVEAVGICMTRYRKIGRLYMAFKDHEIERLFNTLERHKSDLHLAAFTFQTSQQQQHIDQLREIVVSSSSNTLGQLQLMNAGIKSITSTQAQHIHGTQWQSHRVLNQPPMRPRQRPSRTFKVYIPTSWLARKVFEISVHHTLCGWDWSIVTFNHRSRNSPIFAACERDDVKEVQALISKREASILDVAVLNYDHLDLVRLAVYSESTQVLDWLLEQGIQQYLPANMTTDLLYVLCILQPIMSTHPVNVAHTMYDRLVENGYNYDLSSHIDDRSIPSWFCRAPSLESRRKATQLLPQPVKNYPLADRLKLLSGQLSTTSNSQTLVDYSDYISDDELNQVADDTECAVAIAEVASRVLYLFKKNLVEYEIWDVWQRLTLRVLSADPSAHHMVMWNYNPFHWLGTMGEESYLAPGMTAGISVFEDYLGEWINLIDSAGGATEHYIDVLNERMHDERMRGRVLPISPLRFNKLFYNPLHKRYEFMVHNRYLIMQYRLLHTPGSFRTASSWTPRDIVWQPTQAEELEGRWMFVKGRNIYSKPFRLACATRGGNLQHARDLMFQTQDDHGLFALLLDRASAMRSQRKRSMSETRRWSSHDRLIAGRECSTANNHVNWHLWTCIVRHPIHGQLNYCRAYWHSEDQFDHRYEHMHDCDNRDFLEDYIRRPLE